MLPALTTEQVGAAKATLAAEEGEVVVSGRIGRAPTGHRHGARKGAHLRGRPLLRHGAHWRAHVCALCRALVVRYWRLRGGTHRGGTAGGTHCRCGVLLHDQGHHRCSLRPFLVRVVVVLARGRPRRGEARRAARLGLRRSGALARLADVAVATRVALLDRRLRGCLLRRTGRPRPRQHLLCWPRAAARGNVLAGGGELDAGVDGLGASL